MHSPRRIREGVPKTDEKPHKLKKANSLGWLARLASCGDAQIGDGGGLKSGDDLVAKVVVRDDGLSDASPCIDQDNDTGVSGQKHPAVPVPQKASGAKSKALVDRWNVADAEHQVHLPPCYQTLSPWEQQTLYDTVTARSQLLYRRGNHTMALIAARNKELATLQQVVAGKRSKVAAHERALRSLEAEGAAVMERLACELKEVQDRLEGTGAAKTS